MKKNKKILQKRMLKFFFISLVVLFASCASPKKVTYFQGVSELEGFEEIINFEPKLQIGDILSIHVSAIEGETALAFNLYESPVIEGASGMAKPINYLVDAEGFINFPVLGSLQVAGLTTMQLRTKLSDILKASYITEPLVNIRLINFKVTVLGEVNKPGSYTSTNERISILDAIGLAGDLSIYGKRNDITLIREQNKKRQYIRLDLTDKELFKSPYFYMSQNDVLYIAPNKAKSNSSAVSSNAGVILSSISILITILAILIK
ncbi:polysaccharide biosynthesis/export family protein [Lutibacter citreus]|uniref:polysaccharide biosynthesis/export family protein n=1 Tax=Lutibacter citreus TaxID=2138210 RepID=UPI0015CFA629|nr:polysaccharide biosynthesis/export family protein [Lutibacter citreus]